MCVYSMVLDQYAPLFPRRLEDIPTWNPPKAAEISLDPSIVARIEALEKLVAEFKEAMELAKKLDVLTRQPDCEDPEKAKLLQRIAELEAEIKKFKQDKKAKKK